MNDVAHNSHKQRLRLCIGALVTCIAVAAMMSLGVWQLNRAEHKQQRQAQIQKRQLEAPLTLSDVNAKTDDLRDFPLTLTGKIKKEYIFLLDNRTNKGRIGFHVLVPVETENGFIIVNFGFIEGMRSRLALPEVNLPVNRNTFEGVISVPENNPLIKETVAAGAHWPKVIQQIDLPLMSTLTDESLLPFVVLLNQEPESKFVREWQPVVMPPEKHVGYAIQWFGLALVCFLVFIFAVRAQPKPIKQ